MIQHLTAETRQHIDVDVLVIGAGTAGLPTAVHLAERGFKVVVIESGGERQDSEEHPFNEVVFAQRPYEGAIHGRFRCLGGTSTRWGGALIPFMQGDVERAEWAVKHEEILAYMPKVEQFFGLADGPYSVAGLGGFQSNDFVPRLAKWPAFTNRNVANLLMDQLNQANAPDVWLNAVATEFHVDGDQLRTVVARSLDGGELTISAREIVFAAGAIETTRLLLLVDQQNQGQIFGPDDVLGRYFSDHLSVSVGNLIPSDRRQLNRLAGFQFANNGTMRNLRFELTDGTPLRATIPPCFAHIAFSSDEEGGFNALRELFRYVQQRRLPPGAVLANLARSLPWLTHAVWWRYFEKRLLYPDNAEIQLHIVTEQVASAQNRISLSDDRRDAFGLPLALIEWDVLDADLQNLMRAAQAFVQAWDESALAKLGSVELRPSQNIQEELQNSGGIFHPVGSTRMGNNAQTAVVDAQLRPFRLRNATILATSVLPTSGGGNPTMMLMMLAFRAIDQITNSLRDFGGAAKL